MKTQRLLGILWMAACVYVVASWLWMFISYQSYVPHFSLPPNTQFQAFASPLYLFGAVASFFLVRGARWARIIVGIIALLTTFAVMWEIAAEGMRPKWDVYIGIFALLSAIILLFPRHEPVA